MTVSTPDMRRLLTMVESIAASPQLYFGSRRRMAIGRVLHGRPINHQEPEEHAVEAILEHFRPPNCLPRNASVYLVDQPDADLIERAGGYANFIYEVAVTGPIERNDVSWWSDILQNGAYDYAEGDVSVLPDCRPLAKSYWHGEASKRPLWEYRAATVRLARLV